MPFDQEAFFDAVRNDPFSGSLTEDQVKGMKFILAAFYFTQYTDLRWCAYSLATTYHETAQEMMPIEEYGKGSGQPYGVPDKTTGQTYYGRGFVQLTWRDNYARADKELDLEGEESCEWHAENALSPFTAARVMFRGMEQGWFRSGETLPRYFSDTEDDPYEAREIINGDKHIVPSWSGGVSIGNLIAGYHQSFLEALEGAMLTGPSVRPPVRPPVELTTYRIMVTGPKDQIRIDVEEMP